MFKKILFVFSFLPIFILGQNIYSSDIESYIKNLNILVSFSNTTDLPVKYINLNTKRKMYPVKTNGELLFNNKLNIPYTFLEENKQINIETYININNKLYKVYIKYKINKITDFIKNRFKYIYLLDEKLNNIVKDKSLKKQIIQIKNKNGSVNNIILATNLNNFNQQGTIKIVDVKNDKVIYFNKKNIFGYKDNYFL